MSTKEGTMSTSRWIAAVLVMAAALVMAPGAQAAPPTIMGGERAAFGAWPWQVALLETGVPSRFDAQFCGGTLIAPGVVLTAAHCLYDGDGDALSLRDIDVLTGTTLLRSGVGDRSPVVGGYVADPDSFESPDDLALLWVQHTSPLAVPLPPATFAEAPAFAVGSRVTLAGWGANRDTEFGWSFPRQLKQYAGTVRAKRRGFLWIRSMSASACVGDSGGPVVGRTALGAPVLVGVVHGGRADCATGKAAMFVNVAAQQAFIQEALAKGPAGGAQVAPPAAAAR
jgi:secreted trypsin-like serine protease